MRYAMIAAAAAALLSTGALAQDMNSTHQSTTATRAYAPVATPASPATAAFGQGVTQERRDAAITQEDRLFLMQGDRGLGNG